MNERLLCRVKYLRLPDGADLQTELAILKSAVRMGTQGGHASYAEKVANARRLYSMLEASTENPLIYGRGGARTKGQSGNNLADNIRWVIQNRLGKDQDTVSQYLLHGRDLPEELLREMVAAGATKRLFEGIQPVKARIIQSLHDAGSPNGEIVTEISEAVRNILADYLANGKKLRQDFLDEIVALFPVATASTGELGPEQQTAAPPAPAPQAQAPQAPAQQHPAATGVPEIQDQPASNDEIPTGSGDEQLSENPEESEGTNPEDPGWEAFQQMKAEVFSRLSDFGQAVNEAADREHCKAIALELLEFSIGLCGQFMQQDELKETLRGLTSSG